MNEKFYIKEELKSLAPKLAEINKNDPASIQDSYFAKMQNDVLEVLKAQSIEESQLGDYFDQLPDQVMTRVKPKPRLIPFIYSAAAVLIVVIAAVFLFQQDIKVEDDTNATSFVDSLEDDEMMYILSELSTTTDVASIAIDGEDDLNTLSKEEGEEYLQYLNEIDLIQSIDL